jgi:hypothetical protein
MEQQNQRLRVVVITAMFVLLIFLVAFVWIWNSDRSISIKDVLITNVADTTATIVWTSETQYQGRVVYAPILGNQVPFNWQLGQEIAVDDRDALAGQDAKPRYTHHVTLKNLQPDTKYYFRVAGNLFGKEALVRTFSTDAERDSIDEPTPAYGVLTGETDTDGIIVLHKRAGREGQEEFVSSPLAANNSYSLDINSLGEKLKATELSAVIKLGNKPSVEHEFKTAGMQPFEDIELKQVAAVLGQSQLLRPALAQSGTDAACPDGFVVGALIAPLTGNVNIREAPSLNGRVINRVESFNTAKILEQGDAWVRVEKSSDNAVTGWVNCSVMKLQASPGETPPTATPPGSTPPSSVPPGSTPPSSIPPGSTPPPAAGEDFSSCTATGRIVYNLNVRSQPNSQSQRLGGVKAGEVLNLCPVVQGENINGNIDWYPFNFNGVRAYVTGAYIEITTAVPGFIGPLEQDQVITQPGETRDQWSTTYISTLPSTPVAPSPTLPVPTAPNANPNTAYMPISTDTTAAISDYDAAKSKLYEFWDKVAGATQLYNRVGRKVGLTVGETGTDSLCVASSSLICRPSLVSYVQQINHRRAPDYAQCLLYHETVHYLFRSCALDLPNRSPLKELGAELSAVKYCANMDGAYGTGDYKFSAGPARGVRAPQAGAFVNNFLATRGHGEFTIDQLYSCDPSVVSYYQSPGKAQEYQDLKQVLNNVQISSWIEIGPYESYNQSLSQAPAVMTNRVLGVGSYINSIKAEANTDKLTVDDTGVYSVFVNGNLATTQQLVLNEGQQSLEVQVFEDANNNSAYDEGEKIVENDQIELKQDLEGTTFRLNAGWNLIHIPLTGASGAPIFKASELMQGWNSDGADISQIAKFSDGKFQIFSERDHGEDFDINLGDGLFVFSKQQQAQLNIYGYRPETNPKLILSQGWNLVGFSVAPTSTASALFPKLKEQSVTADTISQFRSGQYQSLVLTDGTTFGNDYNLSPQSGYFIRVEEGGGKPLEL